MVVLNPNGKILLIEVKAGSVTRHNGNIYKCITNREYDVDRQPVPGQYAAILNRLKEAEIETSINIFLAIPD